jgi:hypothetical protein
VSQISPPIRILLVASIGLIAAWMLFLRPSAEEAPAPAKTATAPGVTGLSKAVDSAKDAAGAQEARDAKVQSATGEDAAASKSGSATAGPGAKSGAEQSSTDLVGVPRPVAKALEAEKVVVLLFHNPKSADDVAVRKQLKRVDRWGGEVVVRSADVKSVSRYAKITRGADVQQSPTVVVVDRRRNATTLVGYNDAAAIDQAVVDALRASGGLIKDRYLRAVNDVCRTYGESVWTIPTSNGLGADANTMLTRYERGSARLLANFKAVPAPARHRAFKRASVADLAAIHSINQGLSKRIDSSTSPAAALSALAVYGPRAQKVGKSWNSRMDKHHVLSCGTNY